VLIGLTVVVFVVARMLGDPAKLMLPLEATEEQYLALRKAMGFDDPLYIQFARFVSDVARGDFGKSLWQNVPSLPLVLNRLPATMLLTAGTMTLAILVAIPVGTISAMRPRSFADRLSTVFSLAGVSIADLTLTDFRIDLAEHLKTGQRISAFVLEAWEDGDWKEFARGTTVGYKRLLRFPAVHTERVRLRILSARAEPELARLGLYLLVGLED